MDSILVTGATGNVGRHVVGAVQARGLPVVAAASNPERLRQLARRDVRVVGLDFHDRSTWAPALSDARHMFLMRPPAIANVQDTLNPFLDLARERGVGHVVFLSVAGAGENRLVPHRKVEDHLRAHGDRHTNLRPGFFAQNLESAYRRDILEYDRVYVPAGTRQPVNWIDARDIAEVAALVLAQPEQHRGASYTLAGPGPVAWSEVVETLSAVVGRRIRYVPASILGYMWHLRGQQRPLGAIMVQTILHVLLRFGQGAREDPTLERLLGRPGRRIDQYIVDNADLWRGGA